MGHGTASCALRVIGNDPAKLRSYYGELFGWEFDTSGAVASKVSEAGNYGFVNASRTGDLPSIPGGVAGGAGHGSHVTFYVAVPDVEAALRKGFTDPEGNLIDLAGIG